MQKSTLINRSNSFLSFLEYLRIETNELVHKPKGTFEKIYDKTQATIITPEQLKQFYEIIKLLSKESYLIARLMYGGAKRIIEVLTLKLGQCNFETLTINFDQSKTKGHQKKIPVEFEAEIIEGHTYKG